MGKAPAFQFYASDFLTDTLDWTDEQVGVHVRLMAWSWVNRRGIPREYQRMTRIAPAAESAWPVIGEKWTEGPDGTWINERLEETRSNSDAFRAKQKEKSHLAATARKEKGAKVGGKRKLQTLPTDISVGSPTGRPLEDEEEDEEEVEIEGESEKMIWPTFKDWFDLYAKRRDMGECEKAWAKLNQATHEIIYRHTEDYVKAQPDKTYRKDPIRYLKKKGWLDEVITAKPKQNGQATEDDRDQRRRMVVEANAKFYRERDLANGDKS